VTFTGRQAIYGASSVNAALIGVLLLVLLFIESTVAKVVLGSVELFIVVITIGFANMARAPIRLEIGSAGIQLFARRGTSWFPWQVLGRVEVMRVGGNPHIVGWCVGADTFPDWDNLGGGPRYVRTLNAVAICPISVLRTRRHLVVRALHEYGGNIVGSM
jgi:hypothetical protein